MTDPQPPLTAIDIALEPDTVMMNRALADNAALRANVPQGFALDATHHAHVTLLQCFVRTADLPTIYAATEEILAREKYTDWKLTAFKYYYVPAGPIGLAGIVVEPTTDTGGGSDVGYLANGDWLRFDAVDFGTTPVRTFSARAASGISGGRSGLVEVRLDRVTNPVVSSFAIANTGGWQVWRTVPSNIDVVTGRHDVYLTFTSGQPDDFVNVNWFTFS